MEKKIVTDYLVTLIMVIFCLPLAFAFIPINDLNLKGVTVEITKPEWKQDDWLSGEFQKKFEWFFDYNLGFRKAGVRTANQINYWLGVQRKEVIVGKENELMGGEYIDAYYGKDFLGEDSIRRIITRLASFKTELENKGTRFFVVLAPSKTRLYPDRIPDAFRRKETVTTNYDFFVNGLKDANIPTINFQDWFSILDKKSPYPLFSNLGIHWSAYSSTIATDSLLGYMGQLLGKKVNRIGFKEIATSYDALDTDKDMLELMNLWYPIALNKPLGYFKTELNESPESYRPSVLTVGDSYYWNVIYTGVPARYFADGSVYLYYNSTAYFKNGSSVPVSQLDILKMLKGKDIVMFIYSEPNLCRFGNGIDSAYLSLLQKDSLSGNVIHE
ncbi:MAG: hypothetical protein U0T74_01410 [Chitinophagales bacterium]